MEFRKTPHERRLDIAEKSLEQEDFPGEAEPEIGKVRKMGIVRSNAALKYGRKIFSLDKGNTVLKSISVTEKAMSGEDEMAFIYRLVEKYDGQQGTIEVVFKRGHPDYAIITFS